MLVVGELVVVEGLSTEDGTSTDEPVALVLAGAEVGTSVMVSVMVTVADSEVAVLVGASAPEVTVSTEDTGTLGSEEDGATPLVSLEVADGAESVDGSDAGSDVASTLEGAAEGGSTDEESEVEVAGDEV